MSENCWFQRGSGLFFTRPEPLKAARVKLFTAPPLSQFAKPGKPATAPQQIGATIPSELFSARLSRAARAMPGASSCAGSRPTIIDTAWRAASRSSPSSGFATARINSGSFRATVLPESAVLADAKGSFVYVVGSDKKVTRRAVKTGAVTAQGIAITEGLNGTEKVVLRAGGFLNPGETVNPQAQKN